MVSKWGNSFHNKAFSMANVLMWHLKIWLATTDEKRNKTDIKHTTYIFLQKCVSKFIYSAAPLYLM